MKVVGIGLNKTGTKTLGQCYKYWGLRHLSCSPKAFELWRGGQIDQVLSAVAQFESFEDWPWPLIYQEIDRKFPGTKFVLTRRRDASTWFDSLCAHADRVGPTDFRTHIYGHAMPHEHRAEHIAFYERHNEQVRQHFRNRPGALLEVCWEEGHGWDELSAFLGLERPAVPFPHANKNWQKPPAS